MFCDACQRIFRGNMVHDRPYLHYYYPRDLRQAALDNCYICKWLWRFFVRREQTWRVGYNERLKVFPASSYIFSTIDWTGKRRKPFLDLRFTVLCCGDLVVETCPTFFLEKKTSVANSPCFQFRSLPNTHWPSSLELGAKWLAECLSTHDACRNSRRPQSGLYAPSRLVQIGYPDRTSVSVILNPELKGPGLEYATLSHCWGTRETLRLTSTTLSRLKNGIPISNLPQVFQDAVITAQALGLQFIWIDSLCILQDSHDDWMQEAPRMSQVYRNAIINIAATGAANSEGTSFPLREPSSFMPFVEVKTRWANKKRHKYYMYYAKYWSDVLNDMPLLERAWFVQESFLSQRMIHLTGKELLWECHSKSACEMYPEGIPHRMEVPGERRKEMLQALSHAKIHGKLPAESNKSLIEKSQRMLWYGLVRTYTWKKLSYSTDKLVAFCGLAKVMGSALDDEYYAGLWKGDLLRGLYWYQYGEVTAPASPYRAPTWSWACMEEPIATGDYSAGKIVEPLVEVVDCKVETATGDPFGVVTGGTLTLSGYLKTGVVGPGRPPHDVYFNGFWWDRGAAIELNHDTPTRHFHLMPISIDYTLARFRLFCLLLLPTGTTKGQFTRVGIAIVIQRRLGVYKWEHFREARNEEWFEYNDALTEDGKYTVSII